MIRAFIAIELPQGVREALARLSRDLRSAAGTRAVRWVPAENVHLTLRFLGEVPEKMVPDIGSMLDRVSGVTAPFEMAIGGLGCFPNERRPRVVWVGVEEGSGALEGLARRVEAGVVELGFKPEARPFRPHLTLGRVRRGAAPRDLKSLTRALERVDAESLPVAHIEAIHLFKSELRPDGAHYTRLVSALLRG